MIELQHINKTFTAKKAKTVALSDVNLKIEDGEIFGIIGFSGAGKSTLVRCINLLEKPDSGEVIVDGVDVCKLSRKELNERRRKIGMIFQQFNLLEQRTVAKNVRFPLEVAKVSKEEADEKVKELLKIVGLSDKADVYPSQLSGGQKQRVAIARALTMDPKYILSDEATSALDPKTTASILDLLMEINEKLGITVVFVTHQMEVVRAACQRACVLEQGVVAAENTVENIFIEKPAALARLLGEREKNLPEEGHNLQIAYHIQHYSDGQLLSAMSKDLDYLLPILDGQIREYRGTRMGIFVVNIDDAHFPAAKAYLCERNINWKELPLERTGDKIERDEDIEDAEDVKDIKD